MIKEKKILHVIGKRPKGGIGTFLRNMHMGIDSSKIKFDYLINASPDEQGDFDKAVKGFGGDVFYLPELKYRNTINYIKKLNEFFKYHNEYDIVHLHTANIGVFTFAFALKYGIKYRILHSHNTKYSDKKLNSIRNYFLQLPVKKMANIFFACSEKAGEFLFGNKNFDPKKMFIAKNAIDADVFRFDEIKRINKRNEMNLQNKIVIGHVGRFNPQKNHSFIIDIFKELHLQNGNYYLILIGDGELKDQMIEKVKRENLMDSVVFLGNRNDIDELLQVMDLFLMPSLFEGLPLVGIEVQAAGLPCIMADSITDELKITDYIDFVSLSESSGHWSQVISEKLNMKRRDTYEEIVNAGYDIKNAAKKLEDFYSKLK